jgi:hypothetical protein
MTATNFNEDNCSKKALSWVYENRFLNYKGIDFRCVKDVNT